MKKKRIGILFCMLLIVASVLPVTGTLNKKKIENSENIFLADNDMELTRINSPVSGLACIFDPEITVTNLGSENETVDVNMTIEKKLPGGGTNLEYQQTLVGINFGPNDVIDITFPTWIPDDWQVSENVYIDYIVCACVILRTGIDPNPDNNCTCKNITLYFPYIHDVGVIKIDSPEQGCYQRNVTLPVKATIKNFGQNSESSFFVFADIDTSPPVHFENMVTNINPGEQQAINFGFITFVDEGTFEVEICTQLDVDTNPDNNCTTVLICITDAGDTTAPITTHTLDPPAPNGENGWYNTCVNVTLDATDDICGVVKTEYRLDDGTNEEYYGPWPWKIKLCGCVNSLEYRSIDVCGNIEDWKVVHLYVDTLDPILTVTKEYVFFGKLKFTIWIYDDCSGANMNKLEVYINEVFQEIITGIVPYFEYWLDIGLGIGNHTIKFIGYDMAGNSGSTQTGTFTTRNYNLGFQNSRQLLLRFLEIFRNEFPILKNLLGV